SCHLLFCPPCFLLNVSATPDLYTLSLHDALPILSCVISLPTGKISSARAHQISTQHSTPKRWRRSITTSSNPSTTVSTAVALQRSEEHTSELQSRFDLVCRLLLEKKKKKPTHNSY